MKVLFVSIVIGLKGLSKKGCSAWMQLREEQGALKGFWEFPGGKIEHQEDPLQAAIREVEEEVGLVLKPSQLRSFKTYSYQREDKQIYLHVFLANNFEPEVNRGKWFLLSYESGANEIQEIIPPANINIINEVCRYLKQEYLHWDKLWT